MHGQTRLNSKNCGGDLLEVVAAIFFMFTQPNYEENHSIFQRE